MNINIQTAAMFVFFVFNKNGLIKSCLSFEYLSLHKMSWSHVDWCKFCSHLRSFNVRHFGMLEGTGLISMTSRSPSMAWASLLNFIKIYQLVQKLLGGGHTDRQTDCDLISLTFLFKESRQIRSGVLTAVKMSMLVFWIVMLCELVGRYQRFGVTYCLHLQG
jgi:hypothetical protein